MKTTTFSLCLLAVFIMGLWSCKTDLNEWRYRITGEVKTESGSHPAIWYTDTLGFRGDTAWYSNSDGSVMTIVPPYDIDTLSWPVRVASVEKARDGQWMVTAENGTVYYTNQRPRVGDTAFYLGPKD